MKKISSKNLAQQMAELTCELSRACNFKENSFAAMFNLTPTEFRCLRLFTKSSSISIKRMTNLMGISPGRTTHILSSLEEKKFVKRRVDPRDKRNIIVDLTSKSKPFILNLNENHIKLHENILKKIDPDKRETVIAAMEEVIDALHSWAKSNTEENLAKQTLINN